MIKRPHKYFGCAECCTFKVALQVLSPSAARQAWQQLESQSSMKSDASSISPISKQGSGNMGVKALAAALSSRGTSSAQGSPRDPTPPIRLPSGQSAALLVTRDVDPKRPSAHSGLSAAQPQHTQSRMTDAEASSSNPSSNGPDDPADVTPGNSHDPSIQLNEHIKSSSVLFKSSRDPRGPTVSVSPPAAVSLQAITPQVCSPLGRKCQALP